MSMYVCTRIYTKSLLVVNLDSKTNAYFNCNSATKLLKYASLIRN